MTRKEPTEREKFMAGCDKLALTGPLTAENLRSEYIAEVESWKQMEESQGDPQIPKDMEAIRRVIMDRKQNCGLVVEILWSAMGNLQGHPEMTIEEAIIDAQVEWDCLA